jgi:hypothetical protein
MQVFDFNAVAFHEVLYKSATFQEVVYLLTQFLVYERNSAFFLTSRGATATNVHYLQCCYSIIRERERCSF